MRRTVGELQRSLIDAFRAWVGNRCHAAAVLGASIVLLCCCTLFGQQNAQDPQVAAAMADAVDNLQRQVLAASITPKLTVHNLIDRIGGLDQLRQSLRAAEQIGGTRWLDEQTAQVRLLIDGGSVARTILQIAQANPSKSPLPPAVLQKHLAGWSQREFSAIGTSTASGDVQRLRPPPGNRAWWSVGDEQRRNALLAARDSAIARVLDSLRPIQLDTDRTLEQALAVPEVSDAMHKWLASRPMRSVEFDDDQSVRLELAASPGEIWQALKSALELQKQVPVASGPAAWDHLQDQAIARVAPAVGRGVVPPPPATAGPAPFLLPPEAPSWATRRAEAEATAPAHGPKLRTARAAEALALENLRNQINALRLTGDTTLADAARRSPRIDEAVSRALRRARPYKVDYLPKDAVRVHVSLNLADLWAEMSGEQ